MLLIHVHVPTVYLGASQVAVSIAQLKHKHEINICMNLKLCVCVYVLVLILLLICLTPQIAKNMERWAKSVNAAKSVQQQQMQTVITMEKAESQTSTPAMQQTESISFTTSIEPRRTGIALSSAFVEVQWNHYFLLHSSY